MQCKEPRRSPSIPNSYVAQQAKTGTNREGDEDRDNDPIQRTVASRWGYASTRAALLDYLVTHCHCLLPSLLWVVIPKPSWYAAINF